jgi:predicted Zn-dependent peptidase
MDLVRDKKMALAAGAESEFPGGKYPSLFFFYLIPGLGHSAAENEKELDSVIANLQKEKVDAAALARVKTRTRAGLIRQLDDNAGLAQLLASYYASYGDWKKLFTSIDEIDKVTAEDVQRVAKQYFTAENRTVAATFQPPEPASERQAPAGGSR